MKSPATYLGDPRRYVDRITELEAEVEALRAELVKATKRCRRWGWCSRLADDRFCDGCAEALMLVGRLA